MENVKAQTKSDDRQKRRRADSPEDARSRETALAAVAAAIDKKGLEPVLLDVRDLASYVDYIVIVSGRSDRQVQAISDGIVDDVKTKLGRGRPIGVEGMSGGKWTLIDFGDVIVHVFHHPVREYYDLESLWIDAPRVEVDVPAESRIQPGDTY